MLPAVQKAINAFVNKSPEEIFGLMIDSGVGVEIVDSRYETYDVTVFFKIDDKYFKIKRSENSFGHNDYDMNTLEEVIPKTKTVLVFE